MYWLYLGWVDYCILPTCEVSNNSNLALLDENGRLDVWEMTTIVLVRMANHGTFRRRYQSYGL